MTQCDFCDRELPDDQVAPGTSFFGPYCLDCLLLVREETNKNIALLKKRRHRRQKKAVSAAEYRTMQNDFEDALRDLFSGNHQGRTTPDGEQQIKDWVKEIKKEQEAVE